MHHINVAAIAVVAVAAFVVSTVYYIAFAKVRAESLGAGGVMPDERPPGWKVLVELARNLVLGYVLDRFVVAQGLHDWTGGLSFALWAWLAFPAVLLSGSVIWDKVSPKLAAVHAGDWLIKVLIMGVVLAAWR